MQLGEAFILVRPKTDQFGQELDRDVTAAGTRASTSIGQALTAGVALAGFKRLVDASSDLNESVNVTGLTFDQSEQKIADFAAGAAQSIGQSERAAREATATFGGLLQNVGFLEEEAANTSIQLTTLASDLGSAFNRDPEEAVVALTSALRGETEPIRAFNVQLDDMSVRSEAVRLGLAATTAEVDQQGLVQGRLSLILQQTSRVQGDFANTATEAANAQRINAAEAENSAAAMGDNFLPAYKSGLAVVQALASGFGSLPGPIQTAVVALGAVVALRGPVGNAFGGISETLSKMRTRFTEAGGGASGLKAAITPGALGTTAAVAGITLITSALADNAARAEAARERFKDLTEAFAEGGADAAANTLLRQISDEAPEAIDAMERAGVSARDLIDAAASGEPALNDLQRRLLDVGQASDLTSIEVYQLAQASAEAAGAGADLASQQDRNADAATEAADPLTAQAEALTEVADAADAANDRLDALFGVQQSLDEANAEVQASADALTISIRENGRVWDESRGRGRENMQAARDAATAIREQTIAARASGVSARDAAAGNRFMTESLRRQLLAAGLSRRETDQLIATYGRVPRRVLTDLSVTGSSSGLDRLQGEILAIAESYNQVEANRAAALADLSAAQSSGGGGGPPRSVNGSKGPAPTGRVAAGAANQVVVNVYPQALISTTEELARTVAPAVAAELDDLLRGS